MNSSILPVHPYLRHPLTGGLLQAVGIRANGKPIWPILGASEGPPEGGNGQGGAGGGNGTGAGQGGEAGGQGGAGAQGGGSGAGGAGNGGAGSGNKGFPADTPVADMTPDQQAAYWKDKARKHESRANERSDYDTVKAELDRIKAESMSEQEKAVAAAKAEGEKAGRTAAAQESGTKMVDAHISAAVTAGRMTQDQADAILEGLDRTKYLTKDHDVDTEKLTRLLNTVAPAKSGGRPDHGQGGRGSSTKTSGMEAGKAEAERRFGKKT